MFTALRRHLTLWLTLVLATFSLSAHAASIEKDPQHAWQMVKQGAVVIDVRTAEEFASGHLENAINIPFQQIVAGANHYKLAKDTPIMLYCRSGNRSGKANQMLIQQGYTQTYNGGGYQTLMSHKPQQ